MDINFTIDGVATLLMPQPTQFVAGVYKVVARNSFGETVCWARLRHGGRFINNTELWSCCDHSRLYLVVTHS